MPRIIPIKDLKDTANVSELCHTLNEPIYITKNGYEQAMDVYYKSDLAEKIHQGTEGIQYLDYKVLAQILLKTAAS